MAGPKFKRAGYYLLSLGEKLGLVLLANEFIAAKAIHLKGNEKEMK